MCGPSASGVAALGLSLPILQCLQGRWLTLPKCRGSQGEKCLELPSQLPHLEIPSSIYSPDTTCTPCISQVISGGGDGSETAQQHSDLQGGDTTGLLSPHEAPVTPWGSSHPSTAFRAVCRGCLAARCDFIYLS